MILPKLISGAQPSGNIHLGNYISMRIDSNLYDIYIAIVDLHSLTSISDAKELRKNILLTAAIYYAIYGENAKIFLQSSIPYHAHLSWLLSCYTGLGDLNRMTQYKDKKHDLKNSLGLYAYPVLMAADIILYDMEYVKVGDDQKQHLELAEKIIKHYHHETQSKSFIIPKVIINNARIMNLKNAQIKMSKSLGNAQGVINILDSADDITQKVKKAKTDSLAISIEDIDDRIELKNMKNIFESLDGDFHRMIGKNFSTFKNELSAILIEHFNPIREQVLYLLKDESFLLKMLKQNNEYMMSHAQNNIEKIMLLNPL